MNSMPTDSKLAFGFVRAEKLGLFRKKVAAGFLTASALAASEGVRLARHRSPR
jgi:hypothetical protein